MLELVPLWPAAGRRTHLLQLLLGDPADAVSGEVGVTRLNTAQTAEVLIALLLPLGDQVGVGDLLTQHVVVQLCQMRDRT